ncbi:MAG: hypothetical protein ABW228_00725 [Thermoleophilaceae bacterium]
MAAVSRSYDAHADALVAVEAALSAGIPGEDILVISGSATRDAHEEPVGQFGGTTEPGAPVGEFAGGPEPQGTATGDFASRGQHRGGSFADTDSDVVTDYPEGVERMHVVGGGRITRLLQDAGLDEATAKRDVEALHSGRVLVLVDVADTDSERVSALLEL